MSFSLAIAGGDLVQSGSQLGIVYGSDKLKQDLMLWLTERYGIDRFHPVMGCDFQNYIGGIIGYHTQTRVQSETQRVLDNYQKVQFMGLRQAPTLYSLSELLWSIDSIHVAMSYDTVSVVISVSNAEQNPLSISVSQGV